MKKTIFGMMFLVETLLDISYYPETAVYRGERRLCFSLKQSIYWPSLSSECFAATVACLECAKICNKLRKHASELELFPASQSPVIASIDVLDKLR